MIDNSLTILKPIPPSVSKSLKNYVYALCELIEDGSKKPFYIGRGKGNRCLQHLVNKDDKSEKISQLVKSNNLRIDILRHGLDAETAKIVEATCIDLLSVDNLENKIKGFGSGLGRSTLEEIQQLYENDEVEVSANHAGIAFILNKSYRSSISDMELLEVTRGTWARIPRDPSLKYAYATYNGIVKEVYEIRCWLPAGTQQNFFRDRKLGDLRLKKRYEFVDAIAPNQIRSRYKGKLIKLDRSYGTPFQKVGV
jgi:uncharacterized protein